MSDLLAGILPHLWGAALPYLIWALHLHGAAGALLFLVMAPDRSHRLALALAAALAWVCLLLRWALLEGRGQFPLELLLTAAWLALCLLTIPEVIREVRAR